MNLVSELLDGSVLQHKASDIRSGAFFSGLVQTHVLGHLGGR